MNKEVRELNYADFLILFLNEFQNINKYFKEKAIVSTIISERLKVKKETILFASMEKTLIRKGVVILRALAKKGYIKKYGGKTWEKLKDVPFSEIKNVFLNSRKKEAIIELLKKFGTLTSKELREKSKMSYVSINGYINQINTHIPNLFIISKYDSNKNIYSLNHEVFERYSNLI